jgi:hypothetical protein
VVYGMPKAAVDRGYAVRVVSLEAMASTLMAQCAPESGRGEKSAHGGSGKGASAGQN